MKLITCAALLGAAACSLSTSRPPFPPMPEARVGDLEVEVPAATEWMAKALTDAGIPVERVWPQDGYFETPWFDTATGRRVGGRPLGLDVVRVRGWVTPSAHGSSEIKVETVYRPIADPSLPPRELERSVPWSHPVRILVRNAYRAAGARIMMEEPDAITLSARRAAARPVPPARDSVLPDSLRADTLALDSLPADSLAGDSLAPAERIVAADSVRAPAQQRPQQARDSARAARIPPRDTVRPTPVRPAPARPAVPAARGYTVQVAATSDSAAASLAARRLGAMGIEANVVREGGLLKVRSGAYPTRRAAQTVLGRVRRSFPDAFVVVAGNR